MSKFNSWLFWQFVAIRLNAELHARDIQRNPMTHWWNKVGHTLYRR